MKVYRLLRNNQETGPFTAEELLQKGLKPYDLIWVDGKSAAWRYPSEVDAFKQYIAPVEEQPYDRFYKKEEPVTANKPAEKPRIKPKFRIRADSHKIELVEPETTPAQQYEAPAQAKPAEIKTAASIQTAPAWQEALDDWQTKKPEEEQPATQKSTTKSAPVKKESTIQFPLSSPDELDETYSESFFRPKHNGDKKRQVLSYLVLAVLAPLLIAGMWFGFRHNDAPEEPAATANVTETKDVANKTSTSESTNKPMVVEEKKEDKKPVTQEQKPAPIPADKPVIVPEKHTDVPAAQPKKTTAPLIANATPKSNNKVPHTTTINGAPKATQAAINKKPAVQPVANTPVNNTPTVAATTKPKEDANIAKASVPSATTAANNPPPVVSTKKISSYVDVQQENLPAAPGEKSVRFHVKNLGDAQVDLVVLDLQYFDGRGKLRKGSTMYFKKIPAQNDIAVDAPIVKDADRVSYKVSLLSIEQKGVYIVAE